MKKVLLFITPLLLTACGNPQHEAALRLDASIDSAISATDYEQAITLIDSLNKAYPKEIELRKASNVKRVKAVEQLTMTRIPVMDARIAMYRSRIDSLGAMFTQIRPSAALPPVLIPTSIAKTSFASAACLQPRVNTGEDASDTPWTLAVNAGRDIGVTGMTVSTADGATFDIALPVTDGQMASAGPEAVAPLGQYLSENNAQAVSAVVQGKKGKVNIRISPELSHGIADAYMLACANDSLFKSLATREKLERALQIARDQSANLPAGDKAAAKP